MATSDLHMQMTAFDYVRDKAGSGGSLATIATLIKIQREEAEKENRSCLLFDNGDTYQGNPVADVIAQSDTGDDHPVAKILAALNYGACGLGNHDFDHGLEYLETCLSQSGLPTVCSNLSTAHLPMVTKRHLLTRNVTAPDGQIYSVRIGIVSSMPEKTALWSRVHLQNRATVQPAVPALRREASALKSEGADIVIALAHMGIAAFDEGPETQNLIHEVAQIADVDVIIGGHTHLRFPGPDHKGIEGVDTEAGTIHGKPLVQPGAAGSDLGVMDLELSRHDNASPWRVAGCKVSLVPASRAVAADATVAQIAQPAHEKTRKHLSKRVAYIKQPMHSFFALAHPSTLPALLAEAKKSAIRAATAGTPLADLPLLAASSAPMTGGLDGPENYLYLDAGPVERSRVAGMNPYANNVWAVKTTGAQIVDWLERSAMIFNLLKPDAPDQNLIDPRVPGFHYDAIYGLSYTIDLRSPARFDTAGRLIRRGGRISDVLWQGAPLDLEQSFIVATTDHRANGGGLYTPFSDTDIVVQGKMPLQAAVLRYFESADCKIIRTAKPWRFHPHMDRQALLLTSPRAAEHLDDIAHLLPEICGETEDGFLRVRLHL